MTLEARTDYRPDPYGAMLRGGAVPSIAVAVVAIAVFTLVDG